MKLKFLTAFLACTMATPALADVLIDNVEGLTIDEDGEVKRFTGLVIGDDGKIVQLLERGDDKPQTDYREDGQGRVMIPGLIDAHAHVMGVGIGALTLDLSDTRSLDEALAKIAAFAAENEARPWILGRGWNQEQWKKKVFPSAANLDEVVSDRPVWLMRVDAHAGWANSEALRRAAGRGDSNGSLVVTEANARRLADTLAE
ncbi:MAG: amidohydrolase family protein, partial [Citromicrobium sp.]|nr:amidohydrolase family protein [Citromicrobium sp.]